MPIKRCNFSYKNSHSNRNLLVVLPTAIAIIIVLTQKASGTESEPTPVTSDGTITFLKNTTEWIVAIFTDPLGFLNECINYIIDLIGKILPATPNNLKISNLADNLGSSMPLVGAGIIREVLNSIIQLAGFATIIKIYKLIPFKAT